MKIYGQLEEAQVEIEASEPTHRLGRVYWNSTDNLLFVGGPSSIFEQVTTHKSVLKNRTITADSLESLNAGTDKLVFLDSTSGNTSCTLPAIAGSTGKEFFIIRADSTHANYARVYNSTGIGQMGSNYYLRPGGCLHVVWISGTGWQVVAEQAIGPNYTYDTPYAVVAGTGIPYLPGPAHQTWFVAGSGGSVDITANPQIAVGPSGGRCGDRLTIVGTSDTNTVVFDTGTGLQLSATRTVAAGNILNLVWAYSSGTSLWLEESFINN